MRAQLERGTGGDATAAFTSMQRLAFRDTRRGGNSLLLFEVSVSQAALMTDTST